MNKISYKNIQGVSLTAGIVKKMIRAVKWIFFQGISPVWIKRSFLHLNAILTVPLNRVAVDAITIEPGLTSDVVYCPRSVKNNGVILYFHGGGFEIGSPFTHRYFAGLLARETGYPIILPDYRLAPENPFPAAAHDAVSAYQYLLNAFPPDRIILAGDSAGGGLVIELLAQIKQKKHPFPQAAVLLSPWADLALHSESISANRRNDPILSRSWLLKAAKHYAGGSSYGEVSPLNRDMEGFPPLFVQTGGAEILLDDSKRLVDKASSKGVDIQLDVWAGCWHVWQMYPFVPEARLAIQDIANFTRAAINRAQSEKKGGGLEELLGSCGSGKKKER